MNTYRMAIQHRSGSRFDFECEARNLDEAERIGRDFHPGSRVGRAYLTHAAVDVSTTSTRRDR